MRLIHSICAASLCVGVAFAQPAKQWTLSPTPLVSIGSVDQGGPEMFGRVAGAVRLSTGDLAIADAQASEVRFFDARGRFRRAMGRSGDGPGEYRTISSVHRCAKDTIIVYDPSNLRLTVVSPAGALARTLDVRTIAGNNAPPYEMSCNEDGLFAFIHRSPAPPTGIGPRRPPVSIVLARNGRIVPLGSFPAGERYFNGSNDAPRPLGKVTSVAIGRSVVYVGTGEGSEVAAYAMNGTLIKRLSIPGAPVRLTRGDIDRYVRDRTARAAGLSDTVALARYYRAIEYPEMLPAYRRLLADAQDRLWVEEYALPGASVVNWTIVAPSGAVVAKLRIPSAFEPTEVTASHVTGIWRDENAVPFVRTYAVVR